MAEYQTKKKIETFCTYKNVKTEPTRERDLSRMNRQRGSSVGIGRFSNFNYQNCIASSAVDSIFI